MERIFYAADSLLTGTDIARALLDYAEALAKKGTSATVDIPIRRDDGSMGRANFLIGPASQLVSESEDSTFDEILDGELVRQIRVRIGALGNAQPEHSDAGQGLGIDLDIPGPH
jgi:hypothetical protein